MRAFLCFDIATNEPVGLLPGRPEALKEGTVFPNRMAKESVELARIVRERAKEKKISYREALDEIRAEQPELCRRAAEAVVGLKITPRQIGQGGNRWTIHDFETDASAQISRLAKELVASRGLSFRAALTEVVREHPNLAKRYHESVLGRKL